MSYYEQKRRFLGDIQNIVEDNKGKDVEIAVLEYKFGLKYGFSKQAILKSLKMYEDLGKIEIDDKLVKIKG